MACTHVIKGINKQSNNSLIGQLQDDVILLQLPESFSFLVQIRAIFLYLSGIDKFK